MAQSTWGITLAGWQALRLWNWLISLTPLADWLTADWLKNGCHGCFVGACYPGSLCWKRGRLPRGISLFNFLGYCVPQEVHQKESIRSTGSMKYYIYDQQSPKGYSEICNRPRSDEGFHQTPNSKSAPF